MGLRPAKCYRRLERPYTRVSNRRPKKGYVKGVPRHIISDFEMGKKGNYDIKVFLKSKRDVQIRHNAIEAARIACVRALEKKLGKEAEFFCRVRIHPHHVLRENALATGAGADRFQQGMRASFGSPISRAARVRKEQIMIEVHVDKENENIAKDALRKSSYKLPTTCKIESTQ